MITSIFSEWLCDVDKQMQREEKQFLDNVTTHEASAQNVILENVWIEFIPPNCTSIQLIDMVWKHSENS